MNIDHPPWDKSVRGNEVEKILCHLSALRNRGIDITTDKSINPQYLKEISYIQQRLTLTFDRGFFDAWHGLEGRLYLLDENKRNVEQVTQILNMLMKGGCCKSHDKWFTTEEQARFWN
ncbi:hypothetical protein WN943_004382 [Citrus x changshan-huyou]